MRPLRATVVALAATVAVSCSSGSPTDASGVLAQSPVYDSDSWVMTCSPTVVEGVGVSPTAVVALLVEPGRGADGVEFLDVEIADDRLIDAMPVLIVGGRSMPGFNLLTLDTAFAFESEFEVIELPARYDAGMGFAGVGVLATPIEPDLGDPDRAAVDVIGIRYRSDSGEAGFLPIDREHWMSGYEVGDERFCANFHARIEADPASP